MASDSSEWKNRSSENFIEMYGKEVYEEKLRTQFQHPNQWFPCTDLYMSTLALQGVMVLGTLAKKQRMSHAVGVGVRGQAIVLKNSSLPADEFFTPGRQFPVQIRYSNASDKGDDCLKEARAMAIQFMGDNGKSAFDMLLLTGNVTILTNLDDMIKYLVPAAKGGDAFKTWLLRRPHNYHALCEGFRRCPESFTDLNFHGQMTYVYSPSKGERKLARFRALPADDRPETGRLSAADQKYIWVRDRLPGETRSKTYLRDELKQRVTNEEVQVKIQIQFHDMDTQTDSDAYNAGIEWDESASPWLDFIQINMTTALSDDETIAMKVNPTYAIPKCLSFPEAKSRYSPGSIPYARGRVYWAAQKMR